MEHRENKSIFSLLFPPAGIWSDLLAPLCLSQTISAFKDPQETPDLCENPLLRVVLLQLILWLLPLSSAAGTVVLMAEAHLGQHLFSVFVASVNVPQENSVVVLSLCSHTSAGTNQPFSGSAPGPVRVGLTEPRWWVVVRRRLLSQPLRGCCGDGSSTGACVCLAHRLLVAPQAPLA